MECLKRQYSTFTTDDSIALNGELALNENLPDNLGLLASYIAYTKVNGNPRYSSNMASTVSMENFTTQEFEPSGDQTNELPFDQLTDDQMFFLSYSQVSFLSMS